MSDKQDKHDVDYADPEEKKVEVSLELTKLQSAELPEVKKVTGEEQEECIFRLRAKLYRIRDD